MRARFWRNVIAVGLAHLAALVALVRWAGETKAANQQEVTWLSGGANAPRETATEPEPSLVSAPTPPPTATETPAKSEIILPAPTPAATPTPTPRPSPRATPRPTPKATATPLKKTKAKPTISPTRKKAASPAQKKIEGGASDASKTAKASGKVSTGGTGEGTSGTGSGKADAATANYYGNMLHDRFYQAWDQPRSAVASGLKLSATARIRIEQDGRVSAFKVIKPSGNVLVDESVAAVARKVSQVDALPTGVGRGGHYDVTINFALNPDR